MGEQHIRSFTLKELSFKILLWTLKKNCVLKPEPLYSETGNLEGFGFFPVNKQKYQFPEVVMITISFFTDTSRYSVVKVPDLFLLLLYSNVKMIFIFCKNT